MKRSQFMESKYCGKPIRLGDTLQNLLKRLTSNMMKTALCLLIFLMCPQLTRGQFLTSMISGKIIDAETKQPLPHTNVFLANTTLGTISKLDGSYSIQNIPSGKYQLIVNRVGYHLTVQDVDLRIGEQVQMDFVLEPKPIELGEVQIVALEPKEWKQQLKVFLREFIGITENAKACRLLNPEVLRFQIHPQSKELVAWADSSLRIENHALGYRLQIVLDKFQWGMAGGHYIVFPHFEEMTPKDDSHIQKWRERRRQTYLGSFQHFITSLALGKATEEGFHLLWKSHSDVRSDKYRLISEEQIVFDLHDSTSTMKRLSFSGTIEVVYRPKSQSNIIKLNQNFVLIDASGYVYPPLSIVRDGEWAKTRIADTLPLDYDPKQ